MEVIKNKKILALIGIIMLLLGTFLPYFTVSIFGYSQSISLWGYWEGKIVLALTLANALFIFKDWIEQYVPQLFNNNVGRLVEKANNPKFSLIPTILITCFAIYMIINIDVDSEYIKYGLGFYLLWVGIISLIGHAIFYKKQDEVVQQPTQNIEHQQPINQVICPNCRQAVTGNFCPKCGTPVNRG